MRKRLEEAIGTGELIPVTYDGGSQPGTLRYIQPIRLDGAKIRAFCHEANGLRTFFVDKLHEVEEARVATLPRWRRPQPKSEVQRKRLAGAIVGFVRGVLEVAAGVAIFWWMIKGWFR